MKEMTLTKIKPEREKYVLAGFKYAIYRIKSYEKVDQKYNAGGFLLSKDLSPTRYIDDALVLELEHGVCTNSACVNVNGLILMLYTLEEAKEFLLHYPVPRKRPTVSERKAVYEKYEGHCAYCGREITFEEMQVDHVVAHTDGGDDSIENYNPACDVCNRTKSKSDIEEFRETIRNCARIHHGRKTAIYADSDKIAEYYGLLGDDWKEKPITFYFEKEKNNEQGNR